MATKRKTKQKSLLRPGLVAIIVGVGALGLAVQARAEFSSRVHMHRLGATITLAPSNTPRAATPTPAATPAPKPSVAPAPRVAIAHQVKPVPVVHAAPHSSVSNLVAVQQPVETPGKGGATGQATPTPTSTPSSSSSGQPAPTFAYTSSNWSGYLASDGDFSGVSGSWTVPDVRGNGRTTSADATWIGIGGVTSADLIQVGTDDTVSRSGQASSIAFYEMLPATETPVPGMTVTPGDAMSARLTQLSGSQWQITITDETRSETFNTTVNYASTNSTAEWIEEDPSLSGGRLIPFDDFGFASFSGATTTENGATATLSRAGAQAIIMMGSGGQAVATPSDIDSDGEGFSVSGGG